MKFQLFNRVVTISISASLGPPCTWPIKQRRQFARDIEARSNGTKLDRIKAARHIGIERGYTSKFGYDHFGLREAKEFVELAFGSGGLGDML